MISGNGFSFTTSHADFHMQCTMHMLIKVNSITVLCKQLVSHTTCKRIAYFVGKKLAATNSQVVSKICFPQMCVAKRRWKVHSSVNDVSIVRKCKPFFWRKLQKSAALRFCYACACALPFKSTCNELFLLSSLAILFIHLIRH